MQLVLIFSFAGAAASMNCGIGMPLPRAAKEKTTCAPSGHRKRSVRNLSALPGPPCPSFRTEQADAFSFHVRSCERVGLRREKSLFSPSPRRQPKKRISELRSVVFDFFLGAPYAADDHRPIAEVACWPVLQNQERKKMPMRRPSEGGIFLVSPHGELRQWYPLLVQRGQSESLGEYNAPQAVRKTGCEAAFRFMRKTKRDWWKSMQRICSGMRHGGRRRKSPALPNSGRGIRRSL